MGNMFSAVFSNVAATVQQDLFEVLSPTNSLAIIHRVLITQTTEVGDVQEEGLSIQFRRGDTVSGSGGTTPTARCLDVPALSLGSGGAVEANNTTKANTSGVVVHSEAWNVRGALDYRPTPEERIWFDKATRLCVELATTPADSITMSGTIIFETMGA